MSFNILGVNPGHNGSAALLVDGEIVYYAEEERFSRFKYDGNPFRVINDIIKKWHIDAIVIAGTTDTPKLPWTGEDPYSALVRKYYPKVKVYAMHTEHHITHASCAFYNSGFEEATAIVIDGAGSYQTKEWDYQISNETKKVSATGYEAESLWKCDYDGIQPIYKFYGDNHGPKIANDKFDFDSAITLTKVYEAVSHYLGFGFIEAGKTMGLAPYGKKDDRIPNLFVNNRGSKDVFISQYPAGAFVDVSRFPHLSYEGDCIWHKDKNLITDISKNIAWKVQNDTQNIVASYINFALQINPTTKNIVLSGGYALNCVTNYFLKKNFPDINFYVEPISHDGGGAIGAAKYIWHTHFNDKKIRKQTSIYYGPTYELSEQEDVLKENKDKINVQSISHYDVAKLISEKNIVSIFQGRSEAGPRALGNRSILYDPRDPDGKDFVNTVKGREWFRPFAGSCLKEDVNEWFDMAGLEESPFMMYAVNVAADKVKQIPCITHVDDTCRVQTVTEEQNEHFYKLIKEFKEITGVPILFNTSFNLAGDPLVETLEHALDTLYKSKLKYLYLPEHGVLVTKTISDPEAEEKNNSNDEKKSIVEEFE